MVHYSPLNYLLITQNKKGKALKIWGYYSPTSFPQHLKEPSDILTPNKATLSVGVALFDVRTLLTYT